MLLPLDTSVEQTAGRAQGWTLVALGWLSTAGGILLAPVLPSMAAHFGGSPGAETKIRLVATLPALMIAIFGALAGFLADRIGRRRLLSGAVIMYAAAGAAPIALDSLDSIVVSRALVGLAEAVIMSCSLAMIGDYFTGDARNRWLALQSGSPPVIATLLLALGGALGSTSWRAPFIVYACTVVLTPLISLCLWEQGRSQNPGYLSVAASPRASVSVYWGKLVWICLITVFATTAFMVPIVQMGFLLTERGVTAPSAIGLWAALASTGNTLGSLLFLLLRFSVLQKLGLAFTLFSVGFTVMAVANSSQSVVEGALIANLGAGCAFPALITWALSSLPAAGRGRGSGLWVAASFFGQFVSPLIILWLSHQAGSLDNAILIYASLCAMAVVGCLAISIASHKGVASPS